jgi:hypothetical protein
VAAPQTHFVVTWVVFRIFTWIFGITFSVWETVSIFFWGFFIDFDHFLNPEFVKDVLKVRIPKLLHGRGGEPSPGIKGAPCWMHLWPGFILAIIWGLGSHGVDESFRWWLPIFFLSVHCWGIDRWQISLSYMPDYLSFLHPLKKRGYRRRRGYPVKARAEILAATFLFAAIIVFELFRIVF